MFYYTHYAIICIFCLSLFIGTTSLSFSQSISVKGVWLTNVASSALDSRENIREAVRLCKD